MKQDYTKVNTLYGWAKKLKGFVKNNEYDTIKNNLLKECHLLQRESTEVFSDNFSFPSEISRKIAEKELNFNKSKFSLLEILAYIHDNMERLEKNNIINIILMLCDIAFYRAYLIVEELSYGGLYFQLNMCIILDAMKIKPDNNIDISSILKEVSKKASMNMDMFNMSIIWAIAMLNYKMHVYDMAILFFEKYLKSTEQDKDINIKDKRINARIYIGYCYEKTKNFTNAIERFEQLLCELENVDKKHNIIIELHHGLGHFYNERAIFGNAATKDQDILRARMHMKKALEEKVDYSSCYGSLFHEYGDYENAEIIYKEATVKEDISGNEELAKEMKFYIGQTYSAKVGEDDEQIKEAEKNLDEFEDYCQRTFNKDGIIHAHIFKIRTRLRYIDFTDNIIKRKENREKIKKWYNELKNEDLSDYASGEIKKEYQKTICILNIFRILYADDIFTWHKEDILLYLKDFIDSMPCEMRKLDGEEDVAGGFISNLYKICLDGLWIWCVGSKTLNELIKEEKLQASFKANGIEKISVVPIKNKEKAHRCIHGNGKPDLVVIFPPQERDVDFENEIKDIMKIVSESYFLYSKNISTVYGSNWLQKLIEEIGIPQHYYPDTISHIVPFAYCFRALEILRKQLLEPIPLFSLAPTHFSSSYDFQLGEELEIQPEAFDEIGADNAQKKIRKLLEFVDSKYSSNLLGKHLVNFAANSLDRLCCKNDGVFVACFPQPEEVTGQGDNYISYIVRDSSVFGNEMFVHNIKDGEIYTVKALSSYKNDFWVLEALISDLAKECEFKDKHICYNISLLDDSNISTYCRNLMMVIFGEKSKELGYDCRCILRKNLEKGKEEKCIYVILGATEKKCEVNQGIGKEENDMNHTVFVTYSWENSEKDDYSLDYLQEVKEFVNQLRDNGYKATFDRDMYQHNHNWSEIMIEGLQMDKVIVLLSKEYKRKADDCFKRTGVAFERNTLIGRFNKDRENIILARLSSQRQFEIDEILPLCFSGENVINLASTTPVIDGYDLLFSTLSNNSVVGELHEVNKVINNGKTI